MISQTGTQTISINILSDISKSTGNHTVKFGQLIEYNVENICLQKSYPKWDRETSCRPPSLKKKKKALYEVKSSDWFLSFNMFWSSSSWTYNKNKTYETSGYWSREKLNYDFIKVSSGTIFVTSFCAWFFKKSISHVTFHHLSKFNFLITFNSWDIWQIVYCNCLLTILRRHKFWNFSYLLYQAVFLHDQKLRTKI